MPHRSAATCCCRPTPKPASTRSATSRRGVDTPSPLLQLLRKFVRGAILVDVSQPPWERVLWLHFDHAEFGETALVAELIGRWADLLLLRRAG
ncbi:MAG: NFACT family protein [Caldilineales bacterium]